MSQRVDLDAIEERWLRQCGACDAGLSMSCTCPDGDPRNVIANLVDEVLRLRVVVEAAQAYERDRILAKAYAHQALLDAVRADGER